MRGLLNGGKEANESRYPLKSDWLIRAEDSSWGEELQLSYLGSFTQRSSDDLRAGPGPDSRGQG